jgi:hypothetical protein
MRLNRYEDTIIMHNAIIDQNRLYTPGQETSSRQNAKIQQLFEHALKSVQTANMAEEKFDDKDNKQRGNTSNAQSQVSTSPPTSSSPLYGEYLCLLPRQSGSLQCRVPKEKQSRLSYQGQKNSTEKEQKRSKKEE